MIKKSEMGHLCLVSDVEGRAFNIRSLSVVIGTSGSQLPCVLECIVLILDWEMLNSRPALEKEARLHALDLNYFGYIVGKRLLHVIHPPSLEFDIGFGAQAPANILCACIFF